MRDRTKLKAFELADEVAFLIYQATMKFPKGGNIWLDFSDEKSECAKTNSLQPTV